MIKPATTTRPNPYSEAYAHVSGVREFVTDQLTDARDWARQAQQHAQSVLGLLGEFNPNYTSVAPPELPPLTPYTPGEFELPEITPTGFGSVYFQAPSRPQYAAVPTLPNIDLRDYNPSIQQLVIPDAPELRTFTTPVAPTLSPVNIPDAPALDFPLLPVLEQITIPEFDFTSLPAFDAELADFDGGAVVDVLQWGEQPYRPEVLDDVVAQLRNIWGGGNGIPAAVEQALWERAAEREDLDLRRQLSELDVEYASRGFTQPPGVLAARKQALREEAMLRKQTASRDFAIKMAEIHVDNVRFACEQGVAAENVYFNIWNNIAARAFEVAKAQLEAQMTAYGLRVELFRAKQQAYATRAEVWKSQLDGELQVLRMSLEGAQARGALNELKVRAFSEQVRALLSRVEIYRAEMEGAKVESELNQNLISQFREEVNAYAQQISADKTRFEAYEARVRGELGKAQILDAEARAYAAYVSGQASVADVHAKRADLVVRQNEQSLQEYLGRLEAAKAEMSAQVAAIKASADAYMADTQRFTATAEAQGTKHRVELAGHEAETRTAIALFEAKVKQYEADTEMLIRKAQIQLESLRSTGQISSTIAAGAMAGMHIGATLSGSGQLSASGSNQNTDIEQRSKNYQATFEVEGGGAYPSGW